MSQIGYILMGLALFTPLGLAGATVYLLHNILAKANLFLIAGIMKREAGSYDLKKLGGLYAGRPLLSVFFLISAFALAGFPPLSGFWAKLFVIRAGLEAGAYPVVAVSLVVGLLTLYSMTKIWRGAFWKPHPTDLPETLSAGSRPLYLPVAGLALLTVMMGLWIAPVFDTAVLAADSLLEPSTYIEAVLGGREVLGDLP